MTKIEALKKTVYNLENDVYEYSWYYNDKCNCGILARTILNGKNPSACGFSDSPLTGGDGVFSNRAYCLTTNLPLPLVFESLKNAGFTYDELYELEYLQNERIVKKANLSIQEEFFDVKENLIKYLKTWVEILEESPVKELPKDTKPEVKEVIRYVAVSESIRETANDKTLQTTN